MSGKSGTRLPGHRGGDHRPVGERGRAQAQAVDRPVRAGAQPDPGGAARSLRRASAEAPTAGAVPAASGTATGPAGQRGERPRAARRSDSCASWARTWKRAATSPAVAVTTSTSERPRRPRRAGRAAGRGRARWPGPRRPAPPGPSPVSAGTIPVPWSRAMTPSERTTDRTAAASSVPDLVEHRPAGQPGRSASRSKAQPARGRRCRSGSGGRSARRSAGAGAPSASRAVTTPGLEPDPRADVAEVAHVVVEPLQLRQQHARPRGAVAGSTSRSARSTACA